MIIIIRLITGYPITLRLTGTGEIPPLLVATTTLPPWLATATCFLLLTDVKLFAPSYLLLANVPVAPLGRPRQFSNMPGFPIRSLLLLETCIDDFGVGRLIALTIPLAMWAVVNGVVALATLQFRTTGRLTLPKKRVRDMLRGVLLYVMQWTCGLRVSCMAWHMEVLHERRRVTRPVAGCLLVRRTCD